MRYLKIPKERVGVLIGPNGKVKKRLEKKSGITINIDSELGEVTLDDHECKDPLMQLKLENVVRAIGRGFSPENAYYLLNDEADFYIFDIHDYVGKKNNHVRRLKSRVIGREGKTKRVLEDLTDSKISIYGHTVSVISNIMRISVLKKSIDMILSGSKHASVYRFVESQMKEIRQSERIGFE